MYGGKHASGKSALCPSASVANKELEKSGKLNDNTRNEELTNEDILRIIKDFAYATELCIKAGYDGIEIHGANNFCKVLKYRLYIFNSTILFRIL